MKEYIKDMPVEKIIERLKNGEELKFESRGDEYIFKIINGVPVCLCGKECTSIFASLNMNADKDLYFETPDKLDLEVGKFYKTRGGLKAIVVYCDSKEMFYTVHIIGDEEQYTVYSDGVYDTQEETENDLVAEWDGHRGSEDVMKLLDMW